MWPFRKREPKPEPFAWIVPLATGGWRLYRCYGHFSADHDTLQSAEAALENLKTPVRYFDSELKEITKDS